MKVQWNIAVSVSKVKYYIDNYIKQMNIDGKIIKTFVYPSEYKC